MRNWVYTTILFLNCFSSQGQIVITDNLWTCVKVTEYVDWFYDMEKDTAYIIDTTTQVSVNQVFTFLYFNENQAYFDKYEGDSFHTSKFNYNITDNQILFFSKDDTIIADVIEGKNIEIEIYDDSVKREKSYYHFSPFNINEFQIQVQPDSVRNMMTENNWIDTAGNDLSFNINGIFRVSNGGDIDYKWDVVKYKGLVLLALTNRVGIFYYAIFKRIEEKSLTLLFVKEIINEIILIAK
jgi:hypothetical protein